MAPQTLGLRPSFGFGDRLGSATPGHVEAMRRAGEGISPIFAQQSIREMARTDRSPQQVMGDAVGGMAAAGWSGISGSDADHLKTEDDIDRTAAVGFSMFTIDPSDHVDDAAATDDEATLRSKVDGADEDVFARHRGATVVLCTGTRLEITEQACLRCAVKYGQALRAALSLCDHVAAVTAAAGRDHEIELSVDETAWPTTLAEHYLLADACLRHGVPLVSLAPRFVGDFEKGVDFKGDGDELERSLADHAAIAELLGPYKLGLHSGSDKLSMYSLLARATAGRFHVKTAGTSYLEALRVVARHDAALFRSVVTFARQRYQQDRATYHVSATLASAPTPDAASDPHELEREYLGLWDEVPRGRGFTTPGRQIVHCTFGSVLQDATLGGALRDVLDAHADTHVELLAAHFERHLAALQTGMEEAR